MDIANRLSTATTPDNIVRELQEGLEGPYDLGFLFAASLSPEIIVCAGNHIQQQLNVKQLLGCSCAGIIGAQQEIEGRAGCSLILLKLGDVPLNSFYLDQETLSGLNSVEEWYEFFDVYPNEKPKFLVLSDPFQCDINRFLSGMNHAYPQCPVIGGLASGAAQARENTLFLNGKRYDEGMVGVCLGDHVRIETVVSQGCRPMGPTFIVTKAEGNIVYELAGRPFYKVLEEVFNQAPDQEKALAREAVLVGIAMDEYKHSMARGDFLIRILIGVDTKLGAGAVGDYVRPGQTIRFHVRDALSATEDLRDLLKLQQVKHAYEAPRGALIFCCNGRGMNLFKEKDHDMKIIQSQIGKIPGAGFFCAGEIGPVAGKNFIHGFTSSIALFYAA